MNYASNVRDVHNLHYFLGQCNLFLLLHMTLGQGLAKYDLQWVVVWPTAGPSVLPGPGTIQLWCALLPLWHTVGLGWLCS